MHGETLKFVLHLLEKKTGSASIT